jgi:hypothetical protein
VGIHVFRSFRDSRPEDVDARIKSGQGVKEFIRVGPQPHPLADLSAAGGPGMGHVEEELAHVPGAGRAALGA